jgi:hypothetical protein
MCSAGVCAYTPTDTACTTNVANASSVCQAGACGFQCNPGYTSGGGQCIMGSSPWVLDQSGVSATLWSVWGSSATDVYAVGDGGVILHSTGNGDWAVQTSGVTQTLQAVWGSGSGDVYAVGGEFFAPIALHSTGNGTWTPLTVTGATNDLWTVWGPDAADLYVGQDTSDLFYAQGSAGPWSKQVTSPDPATLVLAVWGASASQIYGVGNDGTIIRSQMGAAWTSETSGTTAALNGIWGSGSTDVYAVGQTPTVILHSTGMGDWTAQTAPGAASYLRGVWGSGPTNVYAVGGGGTILQSSGGGMWTLQPSGSTQYLEAVWGSDANDVYVVGGAGAILHYHP